MIHEFWDVQLIVGPRNPGFYKVSPGIRRHSQVWGPLGSAAKLGALPGGGVCGRRGRWRGRLVSKALACSPFHSLDTPSLSQPLGVLSTLLASLLHASIPPQRGPRGPSSCWCLCGKAQPRSLASRAQRVRGRKQERPGGLRPHVGPLPHFRLLAFLLGCLHSCRVLMSLGAQRTSCAGWDLLRQEQGSSRSRDSWSVLTPWSGGARHALVIWEAAPGMRAVHGA